MQSYLWWLLRMIILPEPDRYPLYPIWIDRSFFDPIRFRVGFRYCSTYPDPTRNTLRTLRFDEITLIPSYVYINGKFRFFTSPFSFQPSLHFLSLSSPSSGGGSRSSSSGSLVVALYGVVCFPTDFYVLYCLSQNLFCERDQAFDLLWFDIPLICCKKKTSHHRLLCLAISQGIFQV